MALAWAGCTGPSSPAAGGGPRSVTVAVEAPLTGPSAAAGADLVRGVRMAVAQLDAGKGILGHQVRVVVGDDRGRLAVARRVAATLVADRPVAVVGPPDPTLAAVVEPLYRRAGLAVLDVAPGGAPRSGVVELQGDDEQLAVLDAQEIVSVLHARTVAVMADPGLPVAAAVPALQALLVQAGVAVPLVADLQKPGDVGTALTELAVMKPDVVVLAVSDAQAGGLAAALVAAGVGSRRLVVETAPGAAAFAGAAGRAGTDTLVGGLPPLSQMAGGPAYQVAYLRRYGVDAGPWGALGADAVTVLSDAARRAGAITGPAVAEAAMNSASLQGVTGDLTIDPDSGRRRVPPLAVLDIAKSGVMSIDSAWAAFSGWPPPSGK